MSLADHVDLQGVTHSSLLEVGAHDTIEQADGGKVLHPREPGGLQFDKELRHQHERISAVHARQYWGRADDRKNLPCHLHDDLVGVAVGEQSGRRAPSCHPIAAGVVDDDQIDAARFLAFGRKPGSGPAADNGNTLFDHGAKLLHDRSSLDARHGWPRRVCRCYGAISRKFSTRASANSGSLICSGR